MMENDSRHVLDKQSPFWYDLTKKDLNLRAFKANVNKVRRIKGNSRTIVKGKLIFKEKVKPKDVVLNIADLTVNGVDAKSFQRHLVKTKDGETVLTNRGLVTLQAKKILGSEEVPGTVERTKLHSTKKASDAAAKNAGDKAAITGTGHDVPKNK